LRIVSVGEPRSTEGHGGVVVGVDSRPVREDTQFVSVREKVSKEADGISKSELLEALGEHGRFGTAFEPIGRICERGSRANETDDGRFNVEP
jgi:hypothetical protein